MARSTWSAGNCCYFSFNGELRFEGITVTCIIDILHGYTSACYHTHPYIYVQPLVQQDMNSSCHGQEKPTLGSELVDGSFRSQVLSILVPSAGRNGVVSWIYGVVHKPIVSHHVTNQSCQFGGKCSHFWINLWFCSAWLSLPSPNQWMMKAVRGCSAMRIPMVCSFFQVDLVDPMF
jgi:hypothetical protein